MKKVVIFLLVTGSFLFANNTKNADELKEKRIETQLEKEEKYARERAFYAEDEYDFKGAEVDEDSLSSIPILEDDFDFNMDDILL